MVSVIIPMYNSSEYIDACLYSIVNQDYSDIEVIVIEDGSTDDSAALVRAYMEKDERIKLFSQENHGLVYSRKQGIQKASGEYILFVDSDDWIEHDMISSMLAMMEDSTADVVISAANICRVGTLETAKNRADEGIYYGKKLQELGERLFCYEDYSTMAILPFLWNKLWKTELIKDFVLNADENMTIAEDVAIGFPAILSAERVVVTNRSFYNYRKSMTSMLNREKNVEKELENIKRVYKSIIDRSRGWDVANGIRRFIMNQLLTRAYSYANEVLGAKGLFPYCDDMPNSLVIYGAGEFGRELYRYASCKTNVKYWIDRNANLLRQFCLPIFELNECIFEKNDVVIVAVLNRKASECIMQDLIKAGVGREQILLFDINEHVEEKLLEKALEW